MFAQASSSDNVCSRISGGGACCMIGRVSSNTWEASSSSSIGIFFDERPGEYSICFCRRLSKRWD